MMSNKSEPRQSTRQRKKIALAAKYQDIGIRAVAAAVRPDGKQTRPASARRTAEEGSEKRG